MAAPWTPLEKATLENNLVEGIALNHLVQLLASRTAGAIIQQAQKLGYRIEKSKDDGVQRFYQGINRRSRVTASSNTLGASKLIQASIAYLEPLHIISNINVDTNTLAVKFLLENTLRTDPQTICQLSEFILKSRL